MRAAGAVNFPGWRHALMARLLATALRLGIEEEFAVSLIRRRRLVPPTDAADVERWPWAVRVQVLGGFAVQRDGVPLAVEGARGARPIELLKALVALGGREVDEVNLAAQLWPEAEGDRAHLSLKVNVHRLRRLLGEECVTWVKRRLSLDPRRVWIDAWALESALAALEPALRAKQGERVAGLASAALSLHHGEFLRGDTAPWALAARGRLRTRFQRVLGDAVEMFIGRGSLAEAARCCERAIEADPLAERFHRLALVARPIGHAGG